MSIFFKRKDINEADILNALKSVVDLDRVEGLSVQNGDVLFALNVDPAKAKTLESLRLEAENAVKNLRGVKKTTVILTAEKAPSSAPPAPPPIQTRKPPAERLVLPNIKTIIAVASGKGGVGKSTVAVNLAVALARQGLKTGLLDADIYGPSVPLMTGLKGKKPETVDQKIVPLEAHGLKIMSIGFLVENDAATIWRAPMVHSALLQMLQGVAWGDLDVLVVDMPPGTGDTQLTMAQRVPLSGAIIVSTPQDIALLDARKGIEMFRKTNVPVLGLVENMAVYHCPNCGHEAHIFGDGGAKLEAEKQDVAFLGSIPLDIQFRLNGDNGTPSVDGVFDGIAIQVAETLVDYKVKAAG
jgi:ATP-binding protein involved in chromosome partitioning